MADLINNALRRKLAAAEEAGDFARVDLIRKRLGLAPEAAVVAVVTPEPVEAMPAPRKRGRPRKAEAVAEPATENVATDWTGWEAPLVDDPPAEAE